MIELLVVIAIIATLAALTFPVFQQSKRQGFIADNRVRLKQCHLAVSLYRGDNGDVSQLPFNLPDTLDRVTSQNPGTFYGSTSDTWASACGWHRKSKSPFFVLFSDNGQEAMRHYQQFGEQTILIADENCNDASVDISANFVTKRGMGVLIDGTLLTRMRIGDVFTYGFWNSTIP